jgi:hypothetical protein
MRLARITAVPILLSMFAAACSDSRTPTEVVPETRNMQAALVVASHLSGALKDEALRRELIRALSGSSSPEKQVALLELLQSIEGAALRQALASAAGTASSDYLRTYPVLERLEVVVPIRQQRLTWNGSVEPVVAYSESEREAPTAVGPTGNSWSLSANVPPQEPLVLLRPRRTGMGSLPQTSRLATVGTVGDWRWSVPDDVVSSSFVDCNDPVSFPVKQTVRNWTEAVWLASADR